jgi:hypothetical protein
VIIMKTFGEIPEMTNLMHVLVFILSINILSFVPCAFAIDNGVSNSDYLIAKNNNTIVIVDLHSYDTYEQELGMTFEILEISASFPYVSLRREMRSGTPEFFIYDISKKELYRMGNDLNALESRWSPSGKYTYSNMGDSFIIIPTVKLVHYLQTKSGDDIIRIKGHPMGQIAQEEWIGNHLLYASGIGESACWGILNPETKKNYFIACCGFTKNTMFAEKCDFGENLARKVIGDWVALIKSSKLREISYDFYNEVLMITGEQRE